MRTQSWLVLVMVLSGCPLIEVPSDGGFSEDDFQNFCGDAGECGGDGKGPRSSGAAGGSDSDSDEPRGDAPTFGLDAGVSVPGDELPRPGSGGDASDFSAAMEELNRSICACSSLSFDECTDTTAEQRACDAENVARQASTAGAWLECMTNYLHEQTACVRAAACNVDAIQRCEIVAQAANGDPFAARCGEVPVSIDEGSQACSDAGEPTMFPCFAGGEVPVDVVCNGSQDCIDNSDESEAVCGSSGEFACGDGSSIPAAWVCDGEADCSTSADEASCDEPAPAFNCGDGTGVPVEWVCDGEADCSNGSDEAECNSF